MLLEQMRLKRTKGGGYKSLFETGKNQLNLRRQEKRICGGSWKNAGGFVRINID
jgi:hypothetical protein